jgi:hypothetical protein
MESADVTVLEARARARTARHAIASMLAQPAKAVLIATACLCLAACPRDTLDNILINDTRAPIIVSFSLRHPDPAGFPPNVCALTEKKGRLSQEPKVWTRDFGTHRPIHWQPLKGEATDLVSCSWKGTLYPGDGLRVATDTWCADDVSEFRKSNDPMLQRKPTVTALTIEFETRVQSYEGWQVAEQFVRHESGHCLLRVRE